MGLEGASDTATVRKRMGVVALAVPSQLGAASPSAGGSRRYNAGSVQMHPGLGKSFQRDSMARNQEARDFILFYASVLRKELFTLEYPHMDALILAAGYATRLYPLTKTKPKPLLEVDGRPMMEYVVDSLLTIPEVKQVYVVTNAKFAADFQAWADRYSKQHGKIQFTILNDGSTDDSNKLGAIGDIHFVYKQQKLNDDLIIVAGDNLFDSPLTDFVNTCRAKSAPVVALYDVGNLEAIKKYNNITTDATGRITFFEEKPANPKTTLTAIAIYFYPRRALQMIDTYIREGNNPDQPGRLIQWLYKREPVYTHVLKGKWYDIGSLETLEEANRVFARSKVHA